MIRLYDTARKEILPLQLKEEGKVKMYVCGPTVYAAPHLGHGRFVLVYDALRRYLLWRGLEVLFVSNITDIDDKIIERAEQENKDIAEVSQTWEKVWWEVMDRLGVMRPDEIPHATDYVEEMVELVEQLIANGSAYVTEDGIYLSVEKVQGYGLLANQSLENLLEGGGDRNVVGDGKGHPADFALWKLAKEGEPSWPSPWGPGRPGWHTECVVMSLDLLGEGFDLHTGGLDLMFPHHENERAQAVALGKKFANHWMHNGFVEMAGEKMSKSIGNTKNLVDIVNEYDPRAYRLLVLQSHYRSPIEVTDATMKSAASALERVDSLLRRTVESSGVSDKKVLEAVVAALDNDFDTPGAIEIFFKSIREANAAFDAGHDEKAALLAATVREIAMMFGFTVALGDEAPTFVQDLVEQRQAARAAKDFALADKIREKIADHGWVLEDSADGPSLHKPQ